MITSKQNKWIIYSLIAGLPVLLIAHLYAGQSPIKLDDIWNSIFNYTETNSNQLIVRELRFPRLIIGFFAGGGLALTGLLMQTMFNNPLAGPHILGINSGSGLFVALATFTGIPFLHTNYGVVFSAFLGAIIFGSIIVFFSYFIKNYVSLLLIGIMIGSFTSAITSILQSLSSSDELKVYFMWTMGSIQHVGFNDIPLIVSISTIGILATFLLIKPMNALLLGEKHANSLGINVKSIRIIIIIVTALLTGIITAYCGPIAFVGLTVPNLVRMIFKTQTHQILLLSSFLIGTYFLLVCDIIIQLIENQIQIPINAITSIIGAPFVVYIVLKKIK